MADPGNLRKTTSVELGYGVVGQRCAQWEEPPTPEPEPDWPEPDWPEPDWPEPDWPEPATPDDDTPDCDSITYYVWVDAGLVSGNAVGAGGRDGTCYAITLVVGTNCGTDQTRMIVPDAYCGR